MRWSGTWTVTGRNAKWTEMSMLRIFGSCESFFVTDTYHFDDYTKYVSTRSLQVFLQHPDKYHGFNLGEKKKHRDEQYPIDCEKSHEFGARLVRSEK